MPGFSRMEWNNLHADATAAHRANKESRRNESPAVYARRTQTPPTALIAFSAFLEKSLALTITGWFGRRPLPSTLKKP